MTAKKSECVTVRVLDRYDNNRAAYIYHRKRLIGLEISTAISSLGGLGKLYPPFKVNGERVRRNSARKLVTGDVLEVVW